MWRQYIKKSISKSFLNFQPLHVIYKIYLNDIIDLLLILYDVDMTSDPIERTGLDIF